MLVLLNHWTGFIGLLVVLLGTMEAGRQIGLRHVRLDPEWDNRGITTIESTLLALLGLLLAFSFSGAWSRFDNRRDLILREANAIGTAWLRLDLLPGPAREQLRGDFRRYTDLRLADTRESAGRPGAALEAVQAAIWSQAIAAAQGAPDGRIAQTLLPALNEMFDIATARYQVTQAHPPQVVFVMLLVLLLVAALLAGYGMAGSKRRSWLHTGCFLLAMLLALYVTIDLEFPRRGLVRVDSFDQLLVDLRAGMK
jgi:hypothetical protein